MADIKIYKTQELVLKVKTNYDPSRLDLTPWITFIDVLCGDREYQKEAIKTALIYLASGEYQSINDLVAENWRSNPGLHNRYRDLQDYESRLQLPRLLSGSIDLATGTGKSYVMYGVAQIMLGLGMVDKVLVLCPSLTIESGLKEKFANLSGDDRLKATLPESAIWKNPRIVDANQTIKNGDIAVENIHAVYERTGSSIADSLKGQGERVVVLNDEAHHVYNASSDKDIRKWKEFLLSQEYGFKYTLGLTGTAYKDNEYFNDVIYRYSIRQAVDDRVVKSLDYVAKDESTDKQEKFQKIYDNHQEFIRNYRLIKPLTILVTKDIAGARRLHEDLVEFLAEQEGLEREAIEEKVLIVTSHKDHKKNLVTLKTVDDKQNAVEWIVSVSMLTEGWDVKNVFQIVPWEDRAFNSKLLIAQVLGRGLRVPEEYRSPQPKVRVFNHDSWSRNIRGLVDEILEIEMRVVSKSLSIGNRAIYHFDVYTLEYEKQEKVVTAKEDTQVFDYTKNLINLVSQAEQTEQETEYESLSGAVSSKRTVIEKRVSTIDDVVQKIVDTFRTRDFEAKIRFPKATYSKESLPPADEIREIIEKSMHKVGIKSGLLTEDNALRVFQSFQTLFRKRGSTVVFDRKITLPRKISTTSLERESITVGSIRRGATVFYTDSFEEECDPNQKDILSDIIEDQSLPRSASREVNAYCFKTPVDIVLTKQEPERKFVETIIKPKMSEKIDSWIKSRDQHFYSIEYAWRKGEHYVQSHFNPDFILTCGNTILVIEIKSDDDNSDENRAKYKAALAHFDALNNELRKHGIQQHYIFHFLSPSNYPEFAQYLEDGRIFKGEFRSGLEISLIDT